MKKNLLITATIILILNCNAQTDSLYFGQTPPGDTAVVFAPGRISLTNRDEFSIVFSPDGNEAIYLADSLYYIKRENNTWSHPVQPPFSVNQIIITPIFSLDGKKLFYTKYSSDYSSSHIWMVEHTSGGWGEPQLLPSPINSTFNEAGYAETADSVIYFASGRSGNFDIWFKRPSSEQAENLSSINSTSWESGTCIAPDGSYLIFTSGRTGKIGIGDIYVSFKKENNDWTTPVNMEKSGAKINLPLYDQIYPSLSPDGKYLFFQRNKMDTQTDIYWVSTHIIVGLKKYAFAPRLNTQIPNMNIKTDSVINYEIPENTFSCEYGTDSLKYSATLKNGAALPDWLHFDPETRTLSGTPEQAETDSIKITATNKDTASASCTFRINVTSKVGISQVDDNKIKISPNPTTGLVNVSFGNTIKKAKVEIYNLQGIQVFSKTFQNTTSATIDLTGNATGIYIVKVIADRVSFDEKILKE